MYFYFGFLGDIMNKIFGFAAVLLCGLFFAGCSEEDSKVLDDLTGPADTWCTMPVTYASENGTSSTTLNVSFYYSKALSSHHLFLLD